MRSVFLAVMAMAAVVGLAGCDGEKTESSFQAGVRQTEENQQRLIKSIPPPALQTSLERQNLKRRMERLNKESQISYIYLVSYGRVMAYYTVSGKVSSLNSYLTPMEQVVDARVATGAHMADFQAVTVEAPDQDGSYGKNVDGIFFFTTEGVYVEWSGQYLWSDQPLKLAQPVELIQTVGSAH